MEKYTGKTANRGIAIGKIRIFDKAELQISSEKSDDPKKELQRYELAKAEAKQQLKGLYEKAVSDVGKESAAIFEVQSIMADDLDFTESVCRLIQEECAAADFAVMNTGEQLASMFASMDDAYMKERASDIRDLTNRMVTILTGGNSTIFTLEEPAIVLAEDLTPSETIQLDKSKVLAFVTKQGSVNSHTAILARMMGIPALVGTPIQVKNAYENQLAVVNGDIGEFVVGPDQETLLVARELQRNEAGEKQQLLEYKGRESVTVNGRKVGVFANIGDPRDIDLVLENDGEGIGLFRSEFLYLGRDTYPTEEEQFVAYKQVVEALAGKTVVIRTLDIGADKQASYFNLAKEENPALGYRAIRICLERPEIFKTQLRAILRASAFGSVAIMYPMIISVSEVRQIKAIVESVKRELDAEGIPYGSFEQGIMVETPASVIISDMLAKEVDFFSIGTNDLTQYTLAIDRQNTTLDAFFDPHHPAVLRMIEMVVENGHRENCWVGICGELGADLALTERFIAMGVDELSVAPKSVLAVRRTVCTTDLSRKRCVEVIS